MKKDKKPARILTVKEAEEWARTMEPFKIPKLKKRIKRTCDNCADYVVCWVEGTLKNNEQAENCVNWHLDYFEYERLCEEEMGKE